jgi:hypothetical protein
VPRLDRRLQRKRARSDRIGCGPGADSVDYPYPRVLVRRSCERVTVTHARLERPRRVGPRIVKVAATFIKSGSTASPCVVYIELRTRRAGRLLGRSQRLRWLRGADVSFRIRLTAVGMRGLSPGDPAPIVARVISLHRCRSTDRLREGFSFRL